jgi:hypothetical protein
MYVPIKYFITNNFVARTISTILLIYCRRMIKLSKTFTNSINRNSGYTLE